MNSRAMLPGLLLVASVFHASAVAAQSGAQRGAIEHQLFPGRTYDQAVPAPTAALGYTLGKDLASYAEMVPYLQRLVASSNRIRLATHGESYEGRPIYNITISAPENLARLDQIRANLARLADPRTLNNAQDVDAIVRSTPLVIMLVFGTDGAETAGPEAAVQLAYQLTAGTDARTQSLLRDAVVILVPAQNPDANQRAVTWYNAFRVGPDGTADPDASEHQFPWGINSNNHYQLDPNRESVWNIQRESRAMVALYRQWNPQLFVDNHGEHAQYTGPWYVEPLHEILTARQREWHHKFGEAMQAEFTKRKYVYAPWEYGQFDPGYWDTYPNFSGAIAWTTETSGGGSRGIRVERRNGAPYTLADGIIQHVVASDVTIGLAVENRERILRDFFEYKRTAMEEGQRGPVKAYAISSANDPSALAAVMNTMRRNAIDVQRTTRPVQLNGARIFFEARNAATANPNARASAVTLPAGSYILSTAQPESRMLRVLMEPEAKFSNEFLAQVAKAQADTTRSAGRLFYDITAWSIPFTYNLQAYELTEPVPAAALERVTADVRSRGAVVRPSASHALLIDYTSNHAIHALARLRREGVVHRVAPQPFSADGRRFSAGSVAIFRSENTGRDLAALAQSLADESGVTVVGIDAPTTETSFRLEPNALIPTSAGRIAVVMDRPVSPSSYGHIWYTFEQRYGVEFTALNFDRLMGVNLDKYSVLVLPDGNYGSIHKAVAADLAAKLRVWVEKGGTLIGIRGASAWIAAESNNLTAARLKQPAGRQPSRMPSISGAIMRASITDARNPLTFGYQESELPIMVWSALSFEANPAIEAPIRIADAARARISGFVFPESLTHVAGSPYVVRDRRGAGSVVLFLDDPNFRLFWDGLTRLFFNAVFSGKNQAPAF
ncbi:MAG: M14 family zinc carboxypeptidase [Longimicrobiales bacterium]